MNQIEPTGIPTMSSLQIAEITGKNHADVMRDIRSTLEQAEIGLSKFAASYTNSQNKEQPCYHLPRRECDLVISGYSVKYRLAIIDRWHELEAAKPAALDLNNPTVLRALLLDNTEKVIALETTVSILEPQAKALDLIAGMDGSFCITDAAKELQVRPIDLTRYLSQNGWVYKRAGVSEWIAYQNKIQQGCLVTKNHEAIRADGSSRICTQTRITAKGITILAKIFTNQ